MKDSYVWHKDNLKNEYKEIFERIELYGQTGTMDPLTYEERMMDLVDMFATAQERGMPVQKIVGTDVEEFCKEYFGEYTWKDRLKKLPKQMLPLAWLLFVFAVFDILLFATNTENSSSFWTWKTDAGGWLFGYAWGILVSVIIGVLLRPFVFKSKWLSPNIWAIVTLVTVFGGIFCLADLMPVVELPVWIEVFVSGGYLLLYYVVRGFLNYRNHGSIKSQEVVSKISFWGKVDEGIIQDLPKIHKKKFEKKNQKLAKENKPLITEEEYMEAFRKEVAIDKKGSFVATIILIVFVAAVGVSQLFQSGMADGILFIFLLVLIEIPIIKWTWAGYKNSPREIVLKKCEELGIGIVEYARGLENGTIK